MSTRATSTNRDVAAAFSGHRFAEAIPYLADDVEWTSIGADVLRGADAVAAAVVETVGALSDVTTEFRRFVVVDGGDTVVVDSVGVYTEADGTATSVASSDLYEFRAGRVAVIRSFTVEIPDDDPV